MASYFSKKVKHAYKCFKKGKPRKKVYAAVETKRVGDRLFQTVVAIIYRIVETEVPRYREIVIFGRHHCSSDVGRDGIIRVEVIWIRILRILGVDIVFGWLI